MAREILSLFQSIAENDDVTILIVSHHALVNEYVDQVLQIKDGQII
jgi:ABC-type lipoprotein export system ATPase subunit